MTFSYGFYTKIVTDYPVMCAAVVALSLAILLLYFITFIAFYCPVAFVNYKVYDDDDDPLLLMA